MAGGRDIVVVGVCGSGKSVLVQSLRALGYPAWECAQEHSYVPGLWRRHGRPGVLIYLHAGLPAVCRRLNVRWDESTLAAQRTRLAEARAHCDLYIDTDRLPPQQVLCQVIEYLRARRLHAACRHPAT